MWDHVKWNICSSDDTCWWDICDHWFQLAETVAFAWKIFTIYSWACFKLNTVQQLFHFFLLGLVMFLKLSCCESDTTSNNFRPLPIKELQFQTIQRYTIAVCLNQTFVVSASYCWLQILDCCLIESDFCCQYIIHLASVTWLYVLCYHQLLQSFCQNPGTIWVCPPNSYTVEVFLHFFKALLVLALYTSMALLLVQD